MAQRKAARKARIKRSLSTRRPITTKFLDAFADAWNRHDVDRLMTFMSDDCVFEASAGPEVCGTRYEGPASVRKSYAEVFATFPDAKWSGARHVISGNRGVSEWTFSGTRTDGTRVEVTGCDLFTFRNGKIAVKNSYRKNWTREGVTRMVQVWGKSRFGSELLPQHRVSEVLDRTQERMVGRDGIEPPTPGFSVDPTGADHAPPSSDIVDNQADGQR